MNNLMAETQRLMREWEMKNPMLYLQYKRGDRIGLYIQTALEIID